MTVIPTMSKRRFLLSLKKEHKMEPRNLKDHFTISELKPILNRTQSDSIREMSFVKLT